METFRLILSSSFINIVWNKISESIPRLLETQGGRVENDAFDYFPTCMDPN
jgi:hypothetical protein